MPLGGGAVLLLAYGFGTGIARAISVGEAGQLPRLMGAANGLRSRAVGDRGPGRGMQRRVLCGGGKSYTTGRALQCAG